MKVLLADDHALVRSGIRRLLEDMPDVVVTGEADDGEQAMEMIGHAVPDIVLADISMPRMTGLELSAWLARTLPEVKVIILSMHASAEYVVEALNAGAKGYLPKQSAAGEIELALRAVCEGKVYLSPGISRHMVNVFLKGSAGEDRSGARITPRQREVLKLVAQGKSSKDIAALLDISPRTVDAHRAELMDRLGVRDVIGLLREAARRGLVELDDRQ